MKIGLAYFQHMMDLHSDFSQLFQDLLKMNVLNCYGWFLVKQRRLSVYIPDTYIDMSEYMNTSLTRQNRMLRESYTAYHNNILMMREFNIEQLSGVIPSYILRVMEW